MPLRPARTAFEIGVVAILIFVGGWGGLLYGRAAAKRVPYGGWFNERDIASLTHPLFFGVMGVALGLGLGLATVACLRVLRSVLPAQLPAAIGGAIGAVAAVATPLWPTLLVGSRPDILVPAIACILVAATLGAGGSAVIARALSNETSMSYGIGGIAVAMGLFSIWLAPREEVPSPPPIRQVASPSAPAEPAPTVGMTSELWRYPGATQVGPQSDQILLLTSPDIPATVVGYYTTKLGQDLERYRVPSDMPWYAIPIEFGSYRCLQIMETKTSPGITQIVFRDRMPKGLEDTR